jgi:hypothetical protein
LNAGWALAVSEYCHRALSQRGLCGGPLSQPVNLQIKLGGGGDEVGTVFVSVVGALEPD